MDHRNKDRNLARIYTFQVVLSVNINHPFYIGHLGDLLFGIFKIILPRKGHKYILGSILAIFVKFQFMMIPGSF